MKYWKNIILLVIISCLSSPAFSQKLILNGKLSEADFKLVEKTISEIFARTSLISLQLNYGNSTMTKVDRNIGIDAATIGSYYSTYSAFAEEVTCESAQRLISIQQNSGSYKSYVGHVVYPCGNQKSSDYDNFILASVTQLNSRMRPDLSMFFNSSKPILDINSKLSSNTTLTDRKISGTCESVVGGTVFIIEDGKVTNRIPISTNWEGRLQSSDFVKSLKILAVNEKGDSSAITTIRNLTLKSFDSNSFRMLHPGGAIKPNGIASDVVLKCNTMSLNGFYNFQFLIDRQMDLDSVVLFFEDLTGGRVIKKKFLYNMDQSLISISSNDDVYNKVCMYLVYSEFGFKTPCDIDDSYLYFISYKKSDGQRIDTPKKQVFFESFRENYDESPCNCK